MLNDEYLNAFYVCNPLFLRSAKMVRTKGKGYLFDSRYISFIVIVAV